MNKSFSGALDLFGLECPTKRNTDRPEAAALVEVLKALNAHPAVVWCERVNSGAARVGGRFIRFGFLGWLHCVNWQKPAQRLDSAKRRWMT